MLANGSQPTLQKAEEKPDRALANFHDIDTPTVAKVNLPTGGQEEMHSCTPFIVFPPQGTIDVDNLQSINDSEIGSDKLEYLSP